MPKLFWSSSQKPKKSLRKSYNDLASESENDDSDAIPRSNSRRRPGSSDMNDNDRQAPKMWDFSMDKSGNRRNSSPTSVIEGDQDFFPMESASILTADNLNNASTRSGIPYQERRFSSIANAETQRGKNKELASNPTNQRLAQKTPVPAFNFPLEQKLSLIFSAFWIRADLYYDVLALEPSITNPTPRQLRTAYFRQGRAVLATPIESEDDITTLSFGMQKNGNGGPGSSVFSTMSIQAGAPVSRKAKFKFQAISIAHDLLSNDTQRRKYEEWRSKNPRLPPPPPDIESDEIDSDQKISAEELNDILSAGPPLDMESEGIVVKKEIKGDKSSMSSERSLGSRSIASAKSILRSSSYGTNRNNSIKNNVNIRWNEEVEELVILDYDPENEHNPYRDPLEQPSQDIKEQLKELEKDATDFENKDFLDDVEDSVSSFFSGSGSGSWASFNGSRSRAKEEKLKASNKEKKKKKKKKKKTKVIIEVSSSQENLTSMEPVITSSGQTLQYGTNETDLFNNERENTFLAQNSMQLKKDCPTDFDCSDSLSSLSSLDCSKTAERRQLYKMQQQKLRTQHSKNAVSKSNSPLTVEKSDDAMVLSHSPSWNPNERIEARKDWEIQQQKEMYLSRNIFLERTMNNEQDKEEEKERTTQDNNSVPHDEAILSTSSSQKLHNTSSEYDSNYKQSSVQFADFKPFDEPTNSEDNNIYRTRKNRRSMRSRRKRRDTSAQDCGLMGTPTYDLASNFHVCLTSYITNAVTEMKEGLTTLGKTWDELDIMNFENSDLNAPFFLHEQELDALMGILQKEMEETPLNQCFVEGDQSDSDTDYETVNSTVTGTLNNTLESTADTSQWNAWLK